MLGFVSAKAAIQDHFVTKVDTIFVRTEEPLSDEGFWLTTESGDEYPYHYECRTYSFEIADRMACVTAKRCQQIKDYLMEKICARFDVIPQTLESDFMMGPLDGSKVIKTTIPEGARWGVTEQGMSISPIASSAHYLIYELGSYFYVWGGSGSSYAPSEEYVIVMRQPTDWCPSGILTTKEIFKDGKLPRQLIPLLRRQVSQDYGYIYEDGVTRVPDVYLPGKKGITFFFKKGEIAHPVEGNAGVTLTWAQLKPYMKPLVYGYFINSMKTYK